MAVAPVVVSGGGEPGQNSSHLLIRVIDVTFDSSYPTGGEALDFTTLGFDTVLAVIPAGKTTGGYEFAYDYGNSKIIAYWVDTTVDGAAMAEVANATNLSTVVARFVVIGV